MERFLKVKGCVIIVGAHRRDAPIGGRASSLDNLKKARIIYQEFKILRRLRPLDIP